MKKSFKKFVSKLLIICLTVTTVPVYAFADEVVTTADIYTENDTSANKADILAEIEDLRDETTKHFLNSDGSFTAIEYMTPVHFKEKDSDKWMDIDNTLVKAESNTKTGQKITYKPRQSPLDVTITETELARSLRWFIH